jgi:hypothetical protein
MNIHLTLRSLTRWIALFILLFTRTGVAGPGFTARPFPGWDSLIRRSQDIIIARCFETPDPLKPDTNGIVTEITGPIDSSIEVIQTLKGAHGPSKTTLRSLRWLRQGEYYLIAGQYFGGVYQATEPYRVVPLGLNYGTNMPPGDTIEERIRNMLKVRLYRLKTETKEALEEQRGLQEYLSPNSDTNNTATQSKN